jgi:hypothetical protein
MFKIDFEKYKVQQYEFKYFDQWNAFISKVKMPLFHRDFMEYQEDRFQDYSLLILRKIS